MWSLFTHKWPWLALLGLSSIGITAVPPGSQVLSISVTDANPNAENLRSECVTAAAGAGAIQCDDYRFAYSFPTVWRMNRPHTLSLVHNSATLYEDGLLGANVTIPASLSGSMLVEVIVGGSTIHSKTYTDLTAFPRDVPTRVAVELPDLKMLVQAGGSDIIPYTLKVTVGGQSAQASGIYSLVDRRDDFGRGWWVSGYEQVIPNAHGDTILWIGGDGSTVAYAETSTANRFAAVTRGRADTIVFTPTGGGGANAIDFNGSEYLERTSTVASVQGVNQLTWAFWVQTRGQSGRIFGISSGSDPHRVWWFEADNSGSELRSVLFNTAEDDPRFMNATGLSANQWHFVIAQFDGTQSTDAGRFRVWIDGAEKDVSSSSQWFGASVPTILANSTSAPLQVGKLVAHGAGFNGLLGEMGMVQGLLTSVEKNDWYLNGINFNHASMVSKYQWQSSFDDAGSAGNDLQSDSTNSVTVADDIKSATYPVRGTMSSGAYTRYLIGGGRVEFDGAGRHNKSVDVFGNETWFEHTTVNGKTRLAHIALPMFDHTAGLPAQDTVFTFQWSSTAQLDFVRVQGGGINNPGTGQSSQITYDVDKTQIGPLPGAYGLTQIKPLAVPALATKFTYDGSFKGALSTIEDPRGAKTVLTYDRQKVTQVRVDTIGGTAFTVSYEPSSLRGSDQSGLFGPTRTSEVTTLIDGPRPAAVGDTARFWTNGWGATTQRSDAFGAATVIERGNSNYPGFVTKVIRPNLVPITAQYDAQGLLQQTTDSAVAGGATTLYQWDSKWSKPTSVTSPEGIDARSEYASDNGRLLRRWIEEGSASDTTNFNYHLPHGVVTSTLSPTGLETKFGYDSLGNFGGETSPLGIVNRRYRDAMGLDTLVITAVDATDSIFQSIVRDVISRETLRFTRDTRSWSNPTDWSKATTAYDPSTGDRSSVTPTASNPTNGTMTGAVSSWTYDGLGRVASSSPGGESYVYDEAGNVTTRTTGRSHAITMTYDGLNRLTQRVVPEDATQGTFVGDINDFPIFEPSGLVVPADTSVFTYDLTTGDMLTANNRYGQITRTYTDDGLVKTDQLAIRHETTGSFGSYVYQIGYSYDRDRRRTAVKHPASVSPGTDSTSYSYLSGWGGLGSITDPLGSVYAFTYDDEKRVIRKTFPGTGVDTVTYDADSRVKSWSIRTSALQSGLGSWTFEYNDLNKITVVNPEPSAHAINTYNGIGHLATAFELTAGTNPLNEVITTDGLGNKTTVDRDPINGSTAINTLYNSRGQPFDEQEVWTDSNPQPPLWEGSTTVTGYHSGTGAFEYSKNLRPVGVIDGQGNFDKQFTHRVEMRSYYSADERLVVHQTSRDSLEWNSASNPPTSTAKGKWGAYEEYWYDALGRRIQKRARTNAALCEITLRCQDYYERTVWDGDQILWELRAAAPSQPNIGYVHGGEIDAPIGLIRGTASLALHRNWRGLYAASTKTDGTHDTCLGVSPPPGCVNVPWPAGNVRASLEGIAQNTPPWYGTLVLGQRDRTGLMYRRNRYYNPGSGQFTQVDPIGLAGGINVYGYAGGDPINLSDPLGLMPCDPPGSCPLRFLGGGISFAAGVFGGTFSLGVISVGDGGFLNTGFYISGGIGQGIDGSIGLEHGRFARRELFDGAGVEGCLGLVELSICRTEAVNMDAQTFSELFDFEFLEFDGITGRVSAGLPFTAATYETATASVTFGEIIEALLGYLVEESNGN